MRGEAKVYQYRIPLAVKKTVRLNRLPPLALEVDPQPLSGRLQGKKATDIEERVGRALSRLRLPFRFQVLLPVPGSLPGRGKRLDFLIQNGWQQPLEVDGPRWHITSAQLGQDRLREALLNQVFRRIGWRPLKRLKWWQLQDQASADRAVRALWL